jgi:hypothetical protein
VKILVLCCDNTASGEVPRWAKETGVKSMLFETLKSIDFTPSDIYLVMFKEEADKYYDASSLGNLLGYEPKTILLGARSASAAHTVEMAISSANIDEDIFIKDIDSSFCHIFKQQKYNYLCVESLLSFDKVNPNNKCYVKADHNDMVIDIKENVIISDLFSVGGYYFTSSIEFLENYKDLCKNNFPWNKKINISDIIGLMALKNYNILCKRIANYKDYGTYQDWLDIVNKDQL